MRKSLFYLSMIWALSIAISSYGYFDSLEYVKFHGFDNEGSFVEYPAYVGSSFGYVLGILPAAIITEPQRITNYDQASDKLGASILSGTSKTFSIFLGGFPYLLKKGMWDFPVWIVAGNSSNYYEYKPVSAPKVKIDPRLLTEEQNSNINMQTNFASPTQANIPETSKIIQPEARAALKNIKEVTTEKVSLPENHAASDTYEQETITLQPIPISTAADTSISGKNSMDSENLEDKSQKWESSGLPDWVNQQISH